MDVRIKNDDGAEEENEQQNKSRGKMIIMNKNRKCVLRVESWDFVLHSVIGLLCYLRLFSVLEELGVD